MLSTENIHTNGMLIRYISDQTPELCSKAIESDPCSILVIKDKHIEFIRLALSKNGCLLKYIQDQTPELCEIALKQTVEAFRYIRFPTINMCEYALSKNGWYIRTILHNTLDNTPNNTHENVLYHLCKIAVKENGSAIQFIDDQTYELCLLSIFQKSIAIDFIKDLNSFIIWFVRNITGKM